MKRRQYQDLGNSVFHLEYENYPDFLKFLIDVSKELKEESYIDSIASIRYKSTIKTFIKSYEFDKELLKSCVLYICSILQEDSLLYKDINGLKSYLLCCDNVKDSIESIDDIYNYILENSALEKKYDYESDLRNHVISDIELPYYIFINPIELGLDIDYFKECVSSISQDNMFYKIKDYWLEQIDDKQTTTCSLLPLKFLLVLVSEYAEEIGNTQDSIVNALTFRETLSTEESILSDIYTEYSDIFTYLGLDDSSRSEFFQNNLDLLYTITEIVETTDVDVGTSEVLLVEDALVLNSDNLTRLESLVLVSNNFEYEEVLKSDCRSLLEQDPLVDDMLNEFDNGDNLLDETITRFEEDFWERANTVGITEELIGPIDNIKPSANSLLSSVGLLSYESSGIVNTSNYAYTSVSRATNSGNIIDKAYDSIINSVNGFSVSYLDNVTNLFDRFDSKLTDLYNRLTGKINAIVEKIQEVIDKVVEKINKVIDKINGVIDKIQKVQAMWELFTQGSYNLASTLLTKLLNPLENLLKAFNKMICKLKALLCKLMAIFKMAMKVASFIGGLFTGDTSIDDLIDAIADMVGLSVGGNVVGIIKSLYKSGVSGGEGGSLKSTLIDICESLGIDVNPLWLDALSGDTDALGDILSNAVNGFLDGVINAVKDAVKNTLKSLANSLDLLLSLGDVFKDGGCPTSSSFGGIKLHIGLARLGKSNPYKINFTVAKIDSKATKC